MLPEKTWILRFHLPTGETEETVHTDEALAYHHFGLFDQSDADVYTRIDLLSYDWAFRKESLIETLFLYPA